MTIRKFTVPIVTDGAGAATAYTPTFSGKIEQIRYIKTDFANGVNFTSTLDGTGQTVWTQTAVNASAIVNPRVPTHTTAGVASLYAAAGTGVNDKINVSRDRIKFVIDTGGATKSGAMEVIVSDA
ncbi:MAG: hypothetical protein ABJA10_07650 [Aestuariivirga sp.]